MAALDRRAEQIKRPPAKIRGFGWPTAVEEVAAIVNKAQPSFRRYVCRWFARIELGKAFGPRTRSYAITFVNGSETGSRQTFKQRISK
jgi:hypothetical protein